MPILPEELTNLLELHFTQVDIAKLYGCSTRTIRRRITQFGLEGVADYDDYALDSVVIQFVLAFPSAGQKTLEGNLRSQGYRIQRWRIRESLLRIDPWGVEQRSRRVLRRRAYNVRGPNSLWHIDGFQLLINSLAHNCSGRYRQLFSYSFLPKCIRQ